MLMRALLGCALLWLLPPNAHAWEVGPRSDAQIAGEAQLIAVARVKVGSLENLPHDGKFETKAILVIERTLKGASQAKELPIVLGYDSLPVPQSVLRRFPNFGAGDEELPYRHPYVYDFNSPIPLYEFNADGYIGKVCDDIRSNNIWFLRPYHLVRSETPIGAGMVHDEYWPPQTLGILDFRDVQPPSRESHFKELLK